MIEELRARSENYFQPLVRTLAAAGVTPNILTAVSLVAALAAGAAYYSALFLLGGLLVALNSLLDALDGSLARHLGIASRRGDFLDHTVDRFADVAIIVGIALAPGVRVELGLFAVVGVLLTSYMGTQAQAVGAGRVYAGILGRAYRLILVMAASLAAGILPLYGATIMNGLLGFFGVMGIYTALQRFLGVYRGLD